MKAIESNNKKETKILLEKGADINEKDKIGITPLIKAVEKGDKEMIEMLIKKGANINDNDIDGFTPLIIATYNSNTDTVKILLNQGVGINYKDRNGNTALTIAATRNNQEITARILREVIKVNHNNSIKEAINFYSEKLKLEKLKATIYLEILNTIIKDMIKEYRILDKLISKHSRLGYKSTEQITENIKMLEQLFDLPYEVFELIISFI